MVEICEECDDYFEPGPDEDQEYCQYCYHSLFGCPEGCEWMEHEDDEVELLDKIKQDWFKYGWDAAMVEVEQRELAAFKVDLAEERRRNAERFRNP